MSISAEDGMVRIAEADHRIANNLTSLSAVIGLQRKALSKSGKTFTADQVCVLLSEVTARIEVTAKLHKYLATAANNNGIDIGDFLQQVSSLIGKLVPQGRMKVEVANSCEGYINPRDALCVSLIAAELLTNAAKYAHPTGLPVKVHIRCETKEDGSFVVEVSDDGVGFPENFDPSTDGGLGFRLMRALAKELGTELLFEHDSLGVCARLVGQQGGRRIMSEKPR
ncbi:MAG: sensor histidine kinase [Bradyrhizobium sp.]|uniref:sensor histidine kinase n=1 Tax=Bradyrhizobium sp. TaxID=376 RepID=UPI0025B8BC01|nr:sensor histidine kinase [Bradyrhizobium sp.]MBI5260358.1 sensor histidine kinase [Bradyrhizobium sp.]